MLLDGVDVNDQQTQGSFGKYNGTLNTPRVLQFGARYEF